MPADTIDLDDGVMRVLLIGNSFSQDAFFYLCDFLNEDSIVAEADCLHIQSCNLEKHLSNAINNVAKYDLVHHEYGLLEREEDVTIYQTLVSKKWDIVCFQESSEFSGKYYRYTASLPGLISYTRTYLPSATQLWFHMTWAYDRNCKRPTFALYSYNQSIMINSIMDASRQVMRDYAGKIKYVVPSGTAIQNARTTSLGEYMTRDGYHLNQIGRFIAAAVWYEAITGNDVRNVQFRPEGITDEMALPALEAAHAAILSPISITNMSHF